jgi:hypothetical protein
VEAFETTSGKQVQISSCASEDLDIPACNHGSWPL